MTLAPGDVVAVRTGGWAARLIRFGQALRGVPNLDNHIVIVHHADAGGTLWGIEGRPGGMGWVNVGHYASRYMISNADQPKTDAQRAVVCAEMERMLGTRYDWEAIAEDGVGALGLGRLWHEDWHGQGPPAHVVCSSAASWLYGQVQLARPGRTVDRLTMPGDWTAFDLSREWETTNTKGTT